MMPESYSYCNLWTYRCMPYQLCVMYMPQAADDQCLRREHEMLCSG